MLTTHQKQLLSELETEFTKMNQSKTTKTALVQELLDEINVERRGLRELSEYNEKVLYAFYAKLQRDAEDLKEFYAQDGIILDVKFDFFKGGKHCKDFQELLEFDNPKKSGEVSVNVTVMDYHLGLQRGFGKNEQYVTYYGLVYRAQYCGGKTFYKAHTEDYKNLLEKTTDCSRFRRFLKRMLESA
jgi:hypothetical protein